MPSRRRPRASAARGSPARRAARAPRAGAMSRASARSSVDLPQPLAPTTAVICPRGIARSSSSMTARVVVGDGQAAGLSGGSLIPSLPSGWRGAAAAGSTGAAMIDVTIPTGISVGANSSAAGEVGDEHEQRAAAPRRAAAAPAATPGAAERGGRCAGRGTRRTPIGPARGDRDARSARSRRRAAARPSALDAACRVPRGERRRRAAARRAGGRARGRAGRAGRAPPPAATRAPSCGR